MRTFFIVIAIILVVTVGIFAYYQFVRKAPLLPFRTTQVTENQTKPSASPVPQPTFSVVPEARCQKDSDCKLDATRSGTPRCLYGACAVMPK